MTRIRVHISAEDIEYIFSTGNRINGCTITSGLPDDAKLSGCYFDKSSNLLELKFLTKNTKYRYDEIVDIRVMNT